MTSSPDPDLRRRPSFWAACGELLRAWWQVDRIRIAPASGRLLRMRPPCVISIDNEPVNIVSRSISQTPEGISVHYGCQTARGPARLSITLGTGCRGTTLLWRPPETERLLSEADVEFWG